jgi:pimeloyl-ACP methyl ester carboxylesterase
VLLINGLSASHRFWGENFVNGIANAGYRVVVFDNRDTGDLTMLDHMGTPTIGWETL